MSDNRLKVVLCWHMHQPDYRGPDHSDFHLPWVYLHGIKDYVDMVAHLERNPKARAVVNFAPVLLEQIEEYIAQIEAWLEHGERIRDPILSALAGPGLPLEHSARRELVIACRRINERRLVQRFPAFRRLVDMAGCINDKPEAVRYFNDQYLVDLLIWYHLAWMGEFPRENDLHVRSLIKKEHGFDTEDRRRLVKTIGELLAGVLGRYRKLAEQGRVELSVTPYAHPIVPLLVDIGSAREALPEIRMPEMEEYPGGEERARWHIQKGIETFERTFGFRPKGCWPSEGAVSEPTLRLLDEAGFLWAASGQQVLHNSLIAAGSDPLPANWVHTAYRLDPGKISCIFRDDGLSDLIGFTYADWHANDAVSNLVQHLENIAQASCRNPNCLASIIMDGENAWEHYPNNGRYFLEALYERLANHPMLELTTFSDYLKANTTALPPLSEVVTGSWVYGTLSTWIGDPDKNRAWEMLADAKKAFDRVMASGHLSDEQRDSAELQLATCEGSDWFWWFGHYNPRATVSDFERLYRHQLRELYKLLGEEPPDYLFHPFTFGGDDDPSHPHGGVMIKN